MKLELYKPYKTQGGWKAVVVGYDKEDDAFQVWHVESNSTWLHNDDGTIKGYSPPLNLIAGWQEPKPPRTCEFWVNIYPVANSAFATCATYESKEKADASAGQNRIACKHVVWIEGE